MHHRVKHSFPALLGKEQKFLLSLISQHKDVLENKCTKRVVNNQKDDVWNNIAEIFNNQGFAVQRPVENLKKWYQNMKKRRNIRMRMQNMDGSCQDVEATDTSQFIPLSFGDEDGTEVENLFTQPEIAIESSSSDEMASGSLDEGLPLDKRKSSFSDDLYQSKRFAPEEQDRTSYPTMLDYKKKIAQKTLYKLELEIHRLKKSTEVQDLEKEYWDTKIEAEKEYWNIKKESEAKYWDAKIEAEKDYYKARIENIKMENSTSPSET